VITLRGKPRKLVLLVSLILAIGAVGYVQRLRESGSVALRAPSIRARLNYEWPYAINLFMQKPVGGHGDGAYALLAGGFARDDQLEDPRVLANEDRSWLGHPHNEFLELLADLGLAGALGFALALAVTFFRAVKAGDAMIGSLEDTSRRRLIIALAGGLAAVVIEECSSVALREPGLPPIFLTVWAALWALVRPQRSLPMPTSGQRIFPAATFAVVGVAVVAGAGAIAYVGVNDWRGALAYQRGQVQMARQDYKEAAASADFAAERLLDPFRNSSARLSAIWSRSLWFDSILSRADSAPDDSALSVARDALMRLGQLNAIAPRFLGASRREWELCGNLEKAMVGRGKPNDARDAHARFVRALEQNRSDEPFQIELVERLWSAKPGGPATEKLTWLRALLRGGEADDRFRSLLRTLGSQPDASAALAGLLDIAQRDAGHKTDRWSDSLSPETLRIAALVMPGGPAQAIKIVEQADAMYTLAGPRLFAAHAAALHEIVQFRFAIDPTANVDMNLSQLARADEMIEGASSPDKSLPGPKGQTRLRILLAAGKDDAARRQLAVLPAEPGATEASRLAAAYESLAMMFAHSHPDLAQQWRDRANQLHPSP
jgi:hypothetical protein